MFKEIRGSILIDTEFEVFLAHSVSSIDEFYKIFVQTYESRGIDPCMEVIRHAIWWNRISNIGISYQISEFLLSYPNYKEQMEKYTVLL